MYLYVILKDFFFSFTLIGYSINYAFEPEFTRNYYILKYDAPQRQFLYKTIVTVKGYTYLALKITADRWL